MEGIGQRQISMESTLKDLRRSIEEDRKTGRIKKRGASLRVIGMLGYLNSSEPSPLVPRKIDTVGELYSFSHDEMLRKFRFYKQKTWCKLNEILCGYNLPPLNLPAEYGSDSSTR